MGFFRDLERNFRHGVSDIGRGATNWLKNPTKEASHMVGRIGGFVKSPEGLATAGLVAGGLPGAATGYIAGSALDQLKKKKHSGGGGGGEDSRLTNIRRDMTQEADAFKRNLGQYRGDQYQGLLNDANRADLEGTKAIREGASRRGLLYSGMRAGKEAELQGGLQSQLAQGKYDINRESSGLLKKKQLAAQMVGLESLGQLQSNLENYYNLQMQNQLARRQAFGQLASGLGYAAGAAYGAQGSPSANVPAGGGHFGGMSSGEQRGLVFDFEPGYPNGRSYV